MKKFLRQISLLCVVAITTVFAQINMSGNIETHVDSLINAMPTGSAADSNKYQIPSILDLATWSNTITKIAEGNYSAANDSASTIAYRIVKFTHTSSSPAITYYILEKTAASINYWGTFVYNPSPKRGKLFIQSPHPLYDSNTGQQGILIFRNVGARAFYVSGTHRCNSTTNTTCAGTTDVCGGNYKVSDQAHVVNGPLYQATVTMNSTISQMIVIQNHGFGKDIGDPDVIMGNGRTTAPTGTDWLVNVRDELALIDNTLEFKVAHIDLAWTSLTGTTNTQGRFINGSANPCNSSPSSANGRFLHIEQALTGLRNNNTNRKKLSDAIEATFEVDGLTLTSHNGGDNLISGSTQNITWTSIGLINTVKLEYSINNGSTWNNIASSTTNDGSFTWTVPTIGTWRGKIRVIDTENNSVGDSSNSVFKVVYAVFPTTGTTTYVDPAAAFGPRKLNGVYDFHRGIDFPDLLNTPIHPARAGVIVRREDTTITASSGLSRNGNWILVQIDSADGQPQHNAYLHLNAYNTNLSIGDSVSTQDTIGFMGKSGVGINTIHCHFELYKNLSGTSINKDKAKNPFEVLPYANNNLYSISFGTSNDSSFVLLTSPDTELDLDGIAIYGSSATRTIGFNSRTGIDPVDNDNANFNNVFIDPYSFTQDSSNRNIRFWIKQSELGSIDSVTISDINGYTSTIGNNSSGTRYAVATGNWDGAIWATTSGGAAGSASTPTFSNNVFVNSGAIVTINISSAECNSISFGATTSKLSFSSGSVLSVYGDFTLFDVTHTAVSAWGTNSRIVFKGSATQVMRQWSTTAFSTSFNYIKVDKNGGKVTTDGSNMRFGIGDTLEIVNGIFEVASTDDIESRNYAGTASSFALIIRSGGTFTMAGGASHIRRASNSGIETKRIGKVFIFGTALMRSTSSNGLNFGGIDIESGGRLIAASFSNSSTENFNSGTVSVKAGGELEVQSTAPFWESTTAVVNLQQGGKYILSSDPTNAFPPLTFTNNGKVVYSGPSGQTIKDMNYSSLGISSEGIKSWNLSSARTISDTLEISDGTLSLTSLSQVLSVNGVLKLQNDTISTGTNILSLGSSTAVLGTLNYSSGVILGNFRRWFAASTTDSTLFPVGTISKTRPAAVSFTSAPSTGGTLSAFFTDESPSSNGLPLDDAGSSIVNIAADGYWTLTAANGLTEGIYSLALSSNGISGISDYTSLRIIKRSTGNPWLLDGAHAIGVGTNSSPTVRRIGLSGFSEFAIGATVDNPLPVEMNHIVGYSNKFNVTIEWKTSTEISNHGFEIERGAELEFPTSWISVGFVKGNGTSNAPHKYILNDKVSIGGKYVYRIKQLDSGGAIKNTQYITIDVGAMPKELMLFQNYPNPFNPSTSIEFTTPRDGVAIVRVFNSIGQQVAELFNGNALGGWLYQTRFDAATLPSGVYVVRLDAGGSSMVRKVLFLK